MIARSPHGSVLNGQVDSIYSSLSHSQLVDIPLGILDLVRFGQLSFSTKSGTPSTCIGMVRESIIGE